MGFNIFKYNTLVAYNLQPFGLMPVIQDGDYTLYG